MRTLGLLLAIIVCALVGARWLDHVLGLADGTLTYFLVGPLLLVAGAFASYKAYCQLRERREELWQSPSPDGGFVSELSEIANDASVPTDSIGPPDIGGGSD